MVSFSGIENRAQGNEGSPPKSQCKQVEELAFEMTANPLPGPVPHLREGIHSDWSFILPSHLCSYFPSPSHNKELKICSLSGHPPSLQHPSLSQAGADPMLDGGT